MRTNAETPEVHTCEGCGSWTAVPVLRSVLVADPPDGWGWLEGSDVDDGDLLYCPECA